MKKLDVDDTEALFQPMPILDAQVENSDICVYETGSGNFENSNIMDKAINLEDYEKALIDTLENPLILESVVQQDDMNMSTKSSQITNIDNEERKRERKALQRERALERRVQSRSKSRKSRNKTHGMVLSTECFIVSRGWQMDQSKLLKALEKIKCANFSRVQTATTINRVVESIRTHQDAIVIHIGSQELMEAAQSVIKVVDDRTNFAVGQNADNLSIGLSVGPISSVGYIKAHHHFSKSK